MTGYAGLEAARGYSSLKRLGQGARGYCSSTGDAPWRGISLVGTLDSVRTVL